MQGSTFVELMFALAIVGVSVLVQIQQITISLRDHRADLDTQFAYRKAAGMLAEIQSSVDQGVIASAAALEGLDDVAPSPFLTTRLVPTPDHIMSGNTETQTGWRWHRDVDILPVEGAERSRYVRVRVLHRHSQHSGFDVVSVVSGLVNITVRAEPTVQTYDVFAVAIANAPSLWRPLPELRAELQSLVADLAGANPNLRLRVHWIDKLGYGRNPLYVPFVNEQNLATDATPPAYWYPGKLGAGAPVSTLYSADLFGGRVQTESGILHDFDIETNPLPFALADRFNHCMRTPDARALFEMRVARAWTTRTSRRCRCCWRTWPSTRSASATRSCSICTGVACPCRRCATTRTPRVIRTTTRASAS